MSANQSIESNCGFMSCEKLDRMANLVGTSVASTSAPLTTTPKMKRPRIAFSCSPRLPLTNPHFSRTNHC
ncbi:hypothetical protein CsSME_00045895 [Camellia sinensis var. sinensis]